MVTTRRKVQALTYDIVDILWTIFTETGHILYFDIYFTEFGADLTTVLPVFFKYCCKYCYSDSRKLWAVMKGGGLALSNLIQPTISLEMPVPSQGQYGFHSFPVVDWFCLFIYLWVLTFPLLDCSEFGNFVITLIYERSMDGRVVQL